jgi:hypothetical protein
MSVRELAEVAANVATVIALIGIVVAYRQFRADTIAQKHTAAITAWTEYLRLALAHPDFARPQPWLTGAGISGPQFSQYRWFVATLLFACEQVLEAHPDDSAWREIVKAQLRHHHAFLAQPYFDKAVYSMPLATLATEVIGEPPLPSLGTES